MRIFEASPAVPLFLFFFSSFLFLPLGVHKKKKRTYAAAFHYHVTKHRQIKSASAFGGLGAEMSTCAWASMMCDECQLWRFAFHMYLFVCCTLCTFFFCFFVRSFVRSRDTSLQRLPSYTIDCSSFFAVAFNSASPCTHRYICGCSFPVSRRVFFFFLV